MLKCRPRSRETRYEYAFGFFISTLFLVSFNYLASSRRESAREQHADIYTPNSSGNNKEGTRI